MKQRLHQSRRTRTRPRTVAALALVALVPSVLTACGAGSGSSGGGGGVEPGANKEEYVEALSDMDEVEIYLATPMAQGDIQSAAMEAYGAALEEWSGGKLKVEIGFANSLVNLAESQDALTDGRLSMGMYAPSYEPSTFPAFTFVQTLTPSSNRTPLTGFLESLATFIDVGWNTPGLEEEAEKVGIRPLIPMLLSSPATGVLCPDPANTLTELKGRTVMAQSANGIKTSEALGMVPESLTSAEVYEAMQRGVVECMASVLGVVLQQGLSDVAEHYMLSDEAGYAFSAVGIGVSQATYDALPLAAQQLMWDRIDAYLEQRVIEVISRDAEAIADLKAAGGGVVEWDQDVVDVLNEFNESEVDKARDAEVPGVNDPSEVVDEVADTRSDIAAKVDGLDLGVTDEPDYANLDEWWAKNSGQLDLAPFVDLVMTDILGSHRPS